MELEIAGKTYAFKFGMGFLKEINKTRTQTVALGVKENVGLKYAVADLLDGKPEAIEQVLMLANAGQQPRLQTQTLDNYLEDENVDLDELAQTIIDFLSKSNACKKITLMVLEMMNQKDE
jgi:hypothetical protein